MAELNVSLIKFYFFFLFFLLSLSIKTIAVIISRARQNYYGDPWNVFDFIIVMGSFVDIFYSDIYVSTVLTFKVEQDYSF